MTNDLCHLCLSAPHSRATPIPSTHQLPPVLTLGIQESHLPSRSINRVYERTCPALLLLHRQDPRLLRDRTQSGMRESNPHLNVGNVSCSYRYTNTAYSPSGRNRTSDLLVISETFLTTELLTDKGWKTGVEPATARATSWCSAIELLPP